MARGKKKEELTLEEKLERALVPVDEQPYEVPGNWCWTYQNVACQLGDGEKRNNEEYPYLEVKYLRGYKEADLKYTGKYIETNTKVILVDGENSGEVFEISEAGYMGSTFKTLNISAGINEKYLLYFVDSKRDLLRNSKTGSAIPHLNKKLFLGLEFPLPPLEEQQRIVERIENLFTKLDEVKENLQNTLDEMKVRRMSILQKAFRGELTIQWRLDNNVDIDTWEEKQLHEVCKSIFDGDHMPLPKSESGIHFLVISNVNTGYLSFENTRYVPKEYYDNISVTRKPEKGDILYTLVGSYGIPIVVDSDTPFCFQRHMGLLKPNKIDTYFLWYQMQNQEFYNKVTEIANGTAQLTVPIKGLRKLKICCPSENEQKEIVCILNNLLRKENEMKQFVESVLNNVSLLKKTILTKAFRGELGTNKTDEESSIGLLKNILKTQVVI